jgi:uncharacterized repeat protein (TIGR01451 family)
MSAKSYSVSVLLLTIVAVVPALGQWQPSQLLAAGPARTSWNNVWCVATTGETVYAVWSDFRDGDFEVYSKRSTDGGVTWGSDTRLTNAAGASELPSVALAGAAVHVVWRDDRDGNSEIYYMRSTDGGENWSGDIRLTDATQWWGPSVAATDSAVHVFWLDDRDGNYEIYYKRSTDGGESWGSDTRLTYAEVPKFPSVAATGATVHLVWYEEGPGGQVPEGIFYKRSTDGGESWGSDTRLTTGSFGGNVSPSVAVAGATVHAVWKDRRDGQIGVYYKRSTDGGESWSSDARLITPVGTPEWPSVAVVGAAVRLVWRDSADGSQGVYYMCSTDGGENWGSYTRLANYGDWPSVAAAGAEVHVVWTGAAGDIIYKRCGRGSAGSIAGTAFSDDDGDGERDPEERGLPGWTVRLEPGPSYVLTDLDGNYLFHSLPAGEYAVSEPVKTYWQLTFPPSPGAHVVTLGAGQEVTGKDFGNQVYVFIHDLAVSIAGGIARPGFHKAYAVHYENNGTVEVDANVTLVLPSDVSYDPDSSSPGGYYDAETHSVTWDVGSLPAAFEGWLSATVEIAVVPIGTELTASATIEPLEGDANPSDNFDSETEVVRGSYDPNMITVRPDPYITAGDILDCTIYFQNVGNDTAFNIVVREVLDPGIDISTVEPLAASHPYAFGFGAPNELIWSFNDIRLVDSITNEPGSRGFLRFRVHTKAELPPGTTLDNTAAIYFDYNEPVITNTVRLTVVVLGWSAQAPMPLLPSGKEVDAGGWLAYDSSSQSIYAAKGNKTADFYRYDPIGNVWTDLSAWPDGTEREKPSDGAAACADGNGIIYAAKGNNTRGFWKYDATKDSWYQKADVPLGASKKKVRGGTDIVWTGNSGAGCAYLLKGFENEFYRYDPDGDYWEALADAPSGANRKWDKGSWLAYDGANTIYAHRAEHNELYAYDLTGGTWSAALAGMPLVGRSGKKEKSGDGGCGAYVDGSVYALKGGKTQEIWKYTIATNSWSEEDTMPRGASDKSVGAGADIVTAGARLYATKGNKSNELWQFLPRSFLFGELPPGGVQAGRLAAGEWRLAISPNPLAAGFVHLAIGGTSLSRPAMVRLYDVAGRCVGVWKPLLRNGAADLDVRRLAAGVYLVRVEADGFTATQKLVVQR